MILSYKEFKINLDKFNQWLKVNVEQSDGIATYLEHFEIIEKIEFSNEQRQLIQDYYDNLDEAIELASLKTIPDVSPRQIRLGLIQKGVLPSQIDAAINTLSEPNRSIAKVEWESSITFQRHRPLVDMVAAVLGWSSEQIDQLWIDAGKL